MEKLLLRNFQSPGDIVMLTAAVRELHGTYPGRFLTDVRTPCPALWENNPYLTALSEHDPEVQTIECHYPLIHSSNHAPYHFLHGFIEYLNQQLGLCLRPTLFRGDIHLSDEERSWRSQVEELVGSAIPYWIVVAGGKRDFTIKWWDRQRFQCVVEHFNRRILFVQIGEHGHDHPPLEGVLDLRGRTDLRQLIRLVYHAQGVLCPVTLAMHLAAAVPVPAGVPKNRPCVVVAGGREPPHWEAYPHHQYLHRAGALACCDDGGCWKSRVRRLGDGDANDRDENLCVDVVGDLPRCMHLVTTQDVIRAIELYFDGGVASYLSPEHLRALAEFSEKRAQGPAAAPSSHGEARRTLRVAFGHGLGDCVHFAHVAQLYKTRGWSVSIHYEQNKRLVWQAAGLPYAGAEHCSEHRWEYPEDFNRPIAACDYAGNKIAANLSVAPLPPIGDVADLWTELCSTDLEGSVEAHITAEDRNGAERFLEGLPRPIVLLHTAGTNFASAKNLPDSLVVQLYRALLDNCRGSVVLLDWDFRVPTLAHARARHIKNDWGHLSLEQLAALMEQAALLIGVDSGPYHFASMTKTPALGIFLDHHPSCVTLPRKRNVNLVRLLKPRDLNISRRATWNLVEYSGTLPSADDIARHALRILEGPRYGLPIGRDVMVQQWIRDWCAASTDLSAVADRHKTLDYLLRECVTRYQDPTLVETGCIRSGEDWSAGYSTYVFAAFLDGLQRGRLISLDHDAEHCRFARDATRDWGNRTTVEFSDSVHWLEASDLPIDILYIDSMDADLASCADHALQEIQAAEPKLKEQSLVVFDDSPWNGGWAGKGAKAIPYMLQKNWTIVSSGYQTVLARR
jgi:ADP-heptose:LPS heptosyltransferase